MKSVVVPAPLAKPEKAAGEYGGRKLLPVVIQGSDYLHLEGVDKR